MSTHTKGPWTFRQSENGDWYLVSGDGVPFQGNTQYYPWCSENKEDWLLQATAPDLLAAVESEYIFLADIHNEWPGRHSPEGQMKLCRLRDLICKATGRDAQDVQDDYGNRNVAKAQGAAS